MPQRGELLDRRDPSRRGGDLDHHVRTGEPIPQSDRLLDGAGGVVREVGRALERDEPVAPVARVVRRPQQVGGTADVVERELRRRAPVWSWTPELAASRSWSSYRSEPVIALAKIVGFEVAPVTAKSAISAANAPLSSSSRESVSSQIETPASLQLLAGGS